MADSQCKSSLKLATLLAMVFITAQSCSDTKFLDGFTKPYKPETGIESEGNTLDSDFSVDAEPTSGEDDSELEQIDESAELLRLTATPRTKVSPAKVVMIIDNSSSMKEKQERLAASLRSAMDRFRGKDLTFYFYSTTFSWYHPQPYLLPSQSDIIPGTTIMNYSSYPNQSIAAHVTTSSAWVQTSPTERRLWRPSEDPISTLNFMKYDWHLSPSQVRNTQRNRWEAGSLRIHPEMSNAEFEAEKNRIVASIVMEAQGASNELPLCTLVSLVKNDGPNAIFKDGDRAAFVILTDEDHADLECVQSIEQPMTYKTTRAFDLGHYETFIVMDYELRCDQGSSMTWCKNQTWRQMIVSDCKTSSLCNPMRDLDKAQPCRAEQRQAYVQFFQTQHARDIADGKLRITPDANCSAYGSFFYRGGSIEAIPSSNPDLTCFDQPIQVRGVNYPSIAEYYVSKMPNTLWGHQPLSTDPNVTVYEHLRTSRPLCMRSNTAYTPGTRKIIGFEGLNPGVAKFEREGDLAVKLARARFGEKGFHIAAIANLGASNPSGCNLQASSESRRVLNTLERAGRSDARLSVCSESYGVVFDWLEQFVNRQADNEYELPASGDFTKVRLKINDSYRSLNSRDFSIQTIEGGKRRLILRQGLLDIGQEFVVGN